MRLSFRGRRSVANFPFPPSRTRTRTESTTLLGACGPAICHISLKPIKSIRRHRRPRPLRFMSETATEALAEAHGDAVTYLESLLNKQLRVHITDSRMFVGEFRCTDNVQDGPLVWTVARTGPHAYSGLGMQHHSLGCPRIPPSPIIRGCQGCQAG